MHGHPKILLLIFSLLLVISCREEQGKALQFDTNQDGEIQVILLLKPMDAQRASESATVTRPVVNDIWEINKAHGLYDYGMSSSTLNDDRHITPFVMIRGCTDFANAEAYIQTLNKELKQSAKDLIEGSFPVTLKNYETCVKAGDFAQYMHYYKASRKH